MQFVSNVLSSLTNSSDMACIWTECHFKGKFYPLRGRSPDYVNKTTVWKWCGRCILNLTFLVLRPEYSGRTRSNHSCWCPGLSLRQVISGQSIEDVVYRDPCLYGYIPLNSAITTPRYDERCRYTYINFLKNKSALQEINACTAFQFQEDERLLKCKRN